MERKNVIFSKTGKIIVSIFCFIMFFSAGIITLLNSLGEDEETIINYREQSNLDYKVYLKENEFYEQEYLGKDMLYIASLIDKIKLNFNYNFTIDENSDVKFTYDIVGKLAITDENGKNSYFEKSYVLLDKQELKMIDNNTFNINKELDLDYNYYNDLANRFKMSYGINPESKLTIYFVINKDNAGDDKGLILNSNSMMNISIPLSQKAVDIKMDYKDIDETSKVISTDEEFIHSKITFVCGILCVVMCQAFLIRSMRLLNLSGHKKSEYDKHISKLLKEYDRMIVETSTKPMFEGKTIVDINKFEELLDVRDNLKIPIMYYCINEHESCLFYISHEDQVYLHKISSEQFLGKDKK